MKLHPTSIITKTQADFLNLFSASNLVKDFYLSGGTALAGFYIPYRMSEDLDFFSEQEVELPYVITFLKSIKNKLNYKQLDINSSFNRNLIFLRFENSILKTEFTYFPFPQIDKSNFYQKTQIDSPLDIATNKLFTIYQKPRSRDFMDLYMLCQKYNWTIQQIVQQARTKFDWHIDPLQLGTQFFQSIELKDYPNLTIELKEADWQSFFLDEAKNLNKQIFS